VTSGSGLPWPRIGIGDASADQHEATQIGGATDNSTGDPPFLSTK
jgi:hypothetical protein